MNKIKGFARRRLGAETIIVAESIEMIDFDRLVTLNGSASYLWEQLGDGSFDENTAAAILADRYEVDIDTARTDAKELLETWKEAGIIED